MRQGATGSEGRLFSYCGRIACFLVILLAAGCADMRPGLSARYKPGALNPIEVAMPPGALPISQQYFRTADPLGARHNGLDILGKRGTPILAAAAGRVVASYYEPAYGNRIRVDHGTDAEGRRIFTKYYHLNRRLVRVGDRVERGDAIGRMGSTGLLATGSHLHFEVEVARDGDKAEQVDPHFFWVGGEGQVTCFDLKASHPQHPIRVTYPVRCH